MKFGVREICDVVLRAKAEQKIGNKTFKKHEPVIYFDTLKTSSMEGAATTVYAQGGRGNARLMAWEGERTVTFTMEDALISTEGFMILSGAGLVEAETEAVIQHISETIAVGENDTEVELSYAPYVEENAEVYLFYMLEGEMVGGSNLISDASQTISITKPVDGCDAVLVDYYVKRDSGAKQIEITADKFGGNYYLEASTLFRNQAGVDMPAEFIIPNCKIQSNFTFTMASSGDPSTFTFTMDAFPDYTRFDKSKKVLAAIQIIESDDLKA